MNRVIVDCRTGAAKAEPLSEAERAGREALTPRRPRAITRLQLVRAVRAQGTRGAFDAALAGLTPELQEDWSLATTLHHEGSIFAALAKGLGLGEAEADSLFRAAATF